MKIVYICLCGLYMPGWSYQENIMSKYQIQAGNNVSIITSEWIYDKTGKLVKCNETTDDNGARIIRLKIKGGKPFTYKLKRFVNLYETLCLEKPDLIFLHSPQLMDADIVCKYLKNNKNVQLIVDNHCDELNSAKNFLSRYILHGIIWRRSVNLLSKYTDKFYGVTPAREEFLQKVYGLSPNKISLLPFGADDDLVERAKDTNARNTIREKYNIKKDEILLLTGGKIDHNKTETLELMKAVSEMEQQNIKLMIFGSVVQELKDKFDSLLESKNIIFIGWLDSDLIYNFFDACDIVAFPGLHSVLWEQAVGAGKPCLFRKIDGFTHIDLDGNCEYFDVLTAKSIRDLLVSIINENKIEKMRVVAETNGRKFFSYKRIAEDCISK